MRALRSFTVRARLPAALAPLLDLAMNLRWTWDLRTRHLFRWVDPDAWEECRHDPVRLLGQVAHDRLEALAGDDAFLAFMGEVHDDLQRYLVGPQWFQSHHDGALRAVAYFSPEFGITEALPQYSGGLGVLAGDHLKATSTLGIPMVGVGLFYRLGYFHQTLSPDGWQQERYPALDPHAMALAPVEGARVTVDLADTPLVAQVWRAQVGRVPLYLLDADIDENDADGRSVTDRLYGGGTEHRLRQEILLGFGGIRALDAVGERTQVFHTNEGHAGFLTLERIRRAIVDDGLSFAEAVEATRAGTVFTTHTPVPAGIDRFPRDLMERYFKGWAHECEVDFEELMALGHEPGDPHEASFNMAVMSLRLAGHTNGVSKLHGEVSRRMFQALWPGVPTDEVPITSVTNGVHASTWVSEAMCDLLDRYLQPGWYEAGADRWAHVDDAHDDELWRVRERGREQLVLFVRQRLRQLGLAKGQSEADLAWADEALDPRALTIGFARRFAGYKRPTLLLMQPERLRSLLLSRDRPVQLVFAGKAHPDDDHGKDLIRQIVQLSGDPELRYRVAFIEDYDIVVARTMYQGCDVWLNNPRRPQEACGTSGGKAALNGALNCSVLDGWWAEMFDGENGWAISSAESYDDLDQRDRVEAGSLFDLLERQVVPAFYERTEGPVPRRWVKRMRASLRTLGPQVSASRMVRDYLEQLYEPAAGRADALRAEGHHRARALAAWKGRVGRAWHHVRVVSVESDATGADLGASRWARAVVQLDPLEVGDVEVQLVHGLVGGNDELHETRVVTMAHMGAADDGDGHRFEGSFSCDQAGRYGYTVRVVPSHPDLVRWSELGCVTWA